MFVIEGGALVKPDAFVAYFRRLLAMLASRDYEGLHSLSPTLLHPKGPKQKKKRKKPKKNTEKKTICRAEVLGRAAVKPFPVRIVCFFCFVSVFCVFFFLFWGGRPLRRCDGLPFYSPSEDVVSLYVRSLKRRVQKPNARNAAF